MSMMSISVTGTSGPLTEAQDQTLRALMKHLADRGSVTNLHHGDCVGADARSHEIAREVGMFWIIGHPPVNPKLRAYCNFDEVRNQKPYLARNHDLVDESQVLIALPAKVTEVNRGWGAGEWSTVRHARRTNKPCLFIWPDGSTKSERGASDLLSWQS